jgi:lipopolysaccharide transport system permease protein
MLALFRLRPNAFALEEIVDLLRRNYRLVLELARRDVSDQYAGQFLGKAWVILHPLLLMAVYVFIFRVVFGIRLPAEIVVPSDYTVYLLSGLVCWIALQNAMGKGSTALWAHANLVKQVVFPTAILPAKVGLACAIPLVTSLGVLLIYMLAALQTLPWTVILLPVLVGLQVVLMTGMIFILCSLSVFVRDTKDIVAIYSLIGPFLIPVVYMPNWVPEVLRPIIYINPFSYVAMCYQDALFYGAITRPIAWIIFPLVSFLAFHFGYRVFRALQPHFGNVL